VSSAPDDPAARAGSARPARKEASDAWEETLALELAAALVAVAWTAGSAAEHARGGPSTPTRSSPRRPDGRARRGRAVALVLGGLHRDLGRGRVGAIATQSFIDPAYGRLGLDAHAAGKSAPDALRALVAADEGRGRPPVAMIDAEGGAAHTGTKCIAAAGHQWTGYSVQANLMEKPSVWPAMASASRQRRATSPTA